MKVVDAADVVIEVLDARDPLSCRCLDVERLVRRSGADKKVILLLNKIGKHRHMFLFANPSFSVPQFSCQRDSLLHLYCSVATSLVVLKEE